METKETVMLFDTQSGEKEKVFENNYNKACVSIGLSVTQGSVRAQGKLSPDDEYHELSFVDYRTGEITDTASDGIFTVLGSEVLHSIRYIGEDTTAYAKYLY